MANTKTAKTTEAEATPARVPPVGPDPEIQRKVAALVDQAEGVATVARKLGISRAGLTSYLAGTSHRGTTLLIETIYRHLADRGAI